MIPAPSKRPGGGTNRRRWLTLGAVSLLSGGLARSSPPPHAAALGGGSAARESAEGARRASVCSASNPVGVGLRGEYFSAALWQGRPGLVRIDTSIEFSSLAELAGSAAPSPGSVRWTGWVKVPLSGRYRFDGGGADVRIAVANLPLAGKGAPENAGIDLSAGRFYAIRVELDNAGSHVFPLRLQWTTPYGAHYGIPRQLLFLPTDSVNG